MNIYATYFKWKRCMFFRNTIYFYNYGQYDQFYIHFELHIQAVISR